MSRKDIEAGNAFVRLTLQDNAFIRGLAKNSERLKSFGTGMAKIGGAITGAGAALFAPIAAGISVFMEVGDELDKMRQRTGLSVEALGELSHAAGQSGTDLATLETGIAKMQKGITLGSKAFDSLGLSLESLQGMSPEEQFDAVANAIGAIEDPTERAARAMEVFGKSGTQLLPMIEDMGKLRQEARDMGFVMSGKAAADSVKFGDMLANLWKTVKFGAVAIGEAVVPALFEYVSIVQKVMTKGLKWIQDNKELVVVVAKVAAGLMLVGGVITGLGLAIAGIGVAMGGIVSGFGVLATVLGVVLSPLGLIAGALTAGTYLWMQYTESGKNAASGLAALFGELWSTAKDTFSGIYDALASGDLMLAGNIAIAGLRVALLQGFEALSRAVGGAAGDFLGTIGKQIGGGDFKGAWDTAVTAMGALWDGFTEGIKSAFTGAIRVITDAWESMTKKISSWLLKNASNGGIFGKLALLGTGSADALDPEKAKQLRQQQITTKSRLLQSEEADLAGAALTGASPQELAERAKAVADLRAQLEELEALPIDPLSSATKISDGQITGTADAIRAAMDKINADAQAKSDASTGALKDRIRGGAVGASDAVAAAQAELDKAIAAAAAAREETNKERKKQKQQASGPAPDDISKLPGKVFSTYSATALQLAGVGATSSPELAESKKQTKELQAQTALQQSTLDFIRATGASYV